tara:strand:- start:459 stop:662 length:204 start_codon:yes stop_codon:yes gene_type:complete
MKRLDTRIPEELMKRLIIICQVQGWTIKDAVAQGIRLLINWAEAQAPQKIEDTPSQTGFRNECINQG